MDQSPGFNDPLIILQLNPSCGKETFNVMHEALRKMNGISDVRFDLENMKLCIRSRIDPFVIVEEIKKVDPRADLIKYSKEPVADFDRDPKNAPRNHRQAKNPSGYKEDEDFEGDHGDKDWKNARRNHRQTDIPNGYKVEDFEDDDHIYPNNDHKGNVKGFRSDYYDTRDDSVREKARESDEYVCRNYREDSKAPPKVSFDGPFGDHQSMPSRDHYRSQSFRFDERDSQNHRYSTPPEPHYPRNSQSHRYGSPPDAHYVRNSHYGYSLRSYDEQMYGSPSAEPHDCSRRPPSYDEHLRHPHESRGWGMPRPSGSRYHSDFHMRENPPNCNIL